MSDWIRDLSQILLPMYYILVVGSLFPYLINSCSPQYRKELHYLDFYLGIRPFNDGHFEVEGPSLSLTHT